MSRHNENGAPDDGESEHLSAPKADCCSLQIGLGAPAK